MKNQVQVHLIHPQRGLIAKQFTVFPPLVGDELRLSEGVYYRVTSRVWALDEPVCPFERLNVGVVECEK